MVPLLHPSHHKWKDDDLETCPSQQSCTEYLQGLWVKVFLPGWKKLAHILTYPRINLAKYVLPKTNKIFPKVTFCPLCLHKQLELLNDCLTEEREKQEGKYQVLLLGVPNDSSQ